ncbi:NYN domain-containing protein [Cellulomonas dongxiuzhuiae]|uniref:NYN domain-containing protein n=1 Tax=Cellulomonas dongxiuzhuiae TaxID=2819979 RepID=A0ABX8GFY7_9CELL|nr:NYN domain-containing protein [Cellulomonas dongxiuzhuiae]MBO3093681.1 NYN domain-containing protein [Cellulomonas dongxiuzhuiae]QWC14792.1 NYN domain-containing protein [Cellulomonas dongxiuzhuiae]
MAGQQGGTGSDPDLPDVPDALRSALVRLAADVLGDIEPTHTPTALAAVRRFAPRRRAAAGAQPLWVALHEDEALRARVTRVWLQAHEEAGVPATDGSPRSTDVEPTDAEPPPGRPGTDAAVGAWLQGRPWRHLLPAPAPSAQDDPGGRRLEAAERELERLRTALGVAREGERTARDELAGLQRELRRLRSDADRARSEARGLAAAAEQDARRAAADLAAAADERARAAADLRAASAQRSFARDEVRTGQRLVESRVRLLLDTVVDAATGLRAELALPPVRDLPADLVAPTSDGPSGRPTSRGRSVDDPALLDDLLRLPRAHLLVDGYNVSKTGWPHTSLADQRRLLVDGMAALAAQTGAEITCCFDGQAGHRAPAPVRGVRVLFTAGETADDLLRHLVAAEPPGRVLVVATSDREVVHDVEDAGAWAVPSATLVERLRRR